MNARISGRMLLRTYVGLLFWFIVSAYAQLSPGPLHRAHASLEGLRNCVQCHDVGKKVSSEKCLTCHKILKKKIKAGEGLHSRPGYLPCESCHIDHQGRDFALIWWKGGQENFNHSLTGYDLEGAHGKLECRQCHAPQNIPQRQELRKQGKDLKRTFLGLSRNCLSCHHDEHRGQFHRNCLKCHTMRKWETVAMFNHDKTRFPLTGKHRGLDCQKCHKQIVDNKFANDRSYLKYKGIRFASCTDCHQDVHRGKLGRDCKRCHRTFGWGRLIAGRFDHDKTRFPLQGKHSILACEKCHEPNRARRELRFAKCTDCHVDYHQGQFSHRVSKGDCRECHTVSGFVPATFTMADHQQTRFPLTGSHRAIPCNDCHTRVRLKKRIRTIRFRFESLKCQSCHKDPHKGEVKKFLIANGCPICHVVESWHRVKFDHSQTKFPLGGKHIEAACKSCHKPVEVGSRRERLQFIGVARDCQQCHDDVHRGQFAVLTIVRKKVQQLTDCARCHTARNWTTEKFDHNLDATFKLEGAHQKVACNECHKPVQKDGIVFVKYKPIESTCRACHGGKSFIRER